jgi:fumarate hydratase subunit alpha
MGWREIQAKTIAETISRLCIEAAVLLPDDVIGAFEDGLVQEKSPFGRDSFRQLLDNARIARDEGIPLCSDTGLAVVFVELGQDVHIVGGELETAVNQGVRQGYRQGFLRASTLDPIRRENLGDNTPAIIHVEVVKGAHVKVMLLAKGFGSENMSRVELFPPALGIAGVKEYVVQTVQNAGANPCPPLLVGVGIGGTLEKAAIIAKKSLLRPIGRRNADPAVAALEMELLEAVNQLGLGPLGLGGTVTALDVHIETFPTHIASIPVAVNLQCHCVRHREAVI